LYKKIFKEKNEKGRKETKEVKMKDRNNEKEVQKVSSVRVEAVNKEPTAKPSARKLRAHGITIDRQTLNRLVPSFLRK
jgi:hypothetical protein